MTNQINTATKGGDQDEFEIWLSARHKWLQTAGAKYLKKNEPFSEAEMVELADLCFGEANELPNLVFETVPNGSFSAASANQGMQIEAIEKVTGLNAVKSDATLTFSKTGLSIIYGTNGSGKSSFARLLKHMCGARLKDDLIPDVFSDVIVETSAEVKISTSTNNLAWTAKSAPIEQLQHVHVFDNKTASAYFESKNEATYEPKKMRFLTAMIGTCDQVSKILARRKELLVKTLTEIPPELQGTASAKFLTSLSFLTSDADIETNCEITPAQQEERINLESILRQSDTTEKIADVNLEIKLIEALKEDIEQLKNSYSIDNAKLILEARADATNKRRVASEDAKKVFANAPLKGVGEESWKLLWEQARKYSEEHAYTEKSFPVTDTAKCVLCQSDLDDEAKSRLINFEIYVKGALEKAAHEAEILLAEKVSLLQSPPDAEQWALKMKVLNFSDGDLLPEVLNNAKLFLETQQGLDNFKPYDFTTLDEAISSTIERLNKELKTFTDLQDDKKRQEMVATLNELKAREWINGRKDDIVKEKARLVSIQNIVVAEKLCSTNILSTKKTAIGESELAAGYQKRFETELKALAGSRIPINTVPQGGGKGRVTFKLTLNGVKHDYPILRVLSEGEVRTVALAAFIADMKGSEMAMPFVFDDPISSLDQEFEERVAARLVEMAKERQVIVFTHRISLLSLLEDALKKNNDAAANGTGTSIDQSVISLAKFNGKAGFISDTDVKHKNPKKGFQEFKDHQIPKLKKLQAEGKVAEFNEKMSSVCSGYRILLERSIEVILLAEVVQRFRRTVHTLKLPQLGKIKPEDCQFIDEQMTRYSAFEHSQSTEIEATLPSVDELDDDLGKMLTWINDFSKR